MKLSHLIPSPTLPDADIAGLAFDSRCVTPGVLFFAVDGNRDKGSKYVGDALARGAAAIVSQSPRPADGLPADAAWIQVPDVREALSRAACAFYGQPSHALAAYAVRLKIALRRDRADAAAGNAAFDAIADAATLGFGQDREQKI